MILSYTLFIIGVMFLAVTFQDNAIGLIMSIAILVWVMCLTFPEKKENEN